MKNLIGAAALVFAVMAGCAPEAAVKEIPAEHLILMDGDSLSCRILAGDILTTRVLTTAGDTVELDNTTIDRIIHVRSGYDLTDRYVDRKAIKVELAKRAALAKRSVPKKDARSGRNSRPDPFAILAADLVQGSGNVPQLELTILNLSGKSMDSFRLKVHCFDRKGQPVAGVGGRDNVFQATSRIPIDPEEDFTTTLHLRSHPRTEKARVEIYLVDYADRTRWIGVISQDTR